MFHQSSIHSTLSYQEMVCLFLSPLPPSLHWLSDSYLVCPSSDSCSGAWKQKRLWSLWQDRIFFTFLFFCLRRVDWACMLFVSTDLLYSFCSHSFKLESFTPMSLYCWLLISSAGTRLKCLARGHLGSCWAVEGVLVSRWILNWRMQSSDVLKHPSHVVS